MKLKSSSSPPASALCIAILLYSTVYFALIIETANGFDPLIQLPSAGFVSKSTDGRASPRNTSRTGENGVLYIDDFGAKGDGIADDTKIFKNVWKTACSSSSRVKIEFSAGNTYLIRPVNISGPCGSKITLRISGTIVAPKSPDVWKGLDTHKWLYFNRVKHLTVEGGGTVNGMGQEWWALSCKINETNPCQHAPTAMTFHKCNNLKIRNIMLVNSQQMHMAFSSCVRVAASSLKVIAPADSPNTDGIHVSASTHVDIKNSFISTGDDCISIVSNSSRIRINEIECAPGHGISIGSLGKNNSWGQVHDVSVNGAYLSNTENGVRIKTWQGGSGYVRKISFKNIVMENVSNPIIIDQYYCDSLLPCSNQTLAIAIDNISFTGIRGTSATDEAIRFACSDSCPCKKLYLEDILLVSDSGNITSTFCWNAYGSSLGEVYPPPCFSNTGSVIQQKVLSNPALSI